MQRREFIKSAAVTSTASVLFSTGLNAEETNVEEESTKTFSLGYAPHEGMFRALAGKDVIDQIKYAADQGFTAWEDNRMPRKTPELQEKIGKTLDSLGMQMGVFVAYGSFNEPVFARPTKESNDEIVAAMKNAIEIAKRCGARWCTVVPGSVDQGSARLAEGYQTANVIDSLRRCADVLEPAGLVMVLEPLNWYANHGGVFLRRSDQAYAICRAVNSPSCKILFDIYHQQISEGNLIPNIDACWKEIAYFQSGDNPGRKEPYSGEINYQRVFSHIRDKGFEGVIGMEHGLSEGGEQGERKLIAAYRRADRIEG